MRQDSENGNSKFLQCVGHVLFIILSEMSMGYSKHVLNESKWSHQLLSAPSQGASPSGLHHVHPDRKAAEPWVPHLFWGLKAIFTLKTSPNIHPKICPTFHPEDLPDLSPRRPPWPFTPKQCCLPLPHLQPFSSHYLSSNKIFTIHADESKMFYVKLVLLWNGIIINYLVLETSGILLGWVWFW